MHLFVACTQSRLHLPAPTDTPLLKTLHIYKLNVLDSWEKRETTTKIQPNSKQIFLGSVTSLLFSLLTRMKVSCAYYS